MVKYSKLNFRKRVQSRRIKNSKKSGKGFKRTNLRKKGGANPNCREENMAATMNLLLRNPDNRDSALTALLGVDINSIAASGVGALLPVPGGVPGVGNTTVPASGGVTGVVLPFL